MLRIFSLVFFYFISQSFVAQDYSELLREANALVYSNPERSVEISENILRQTRDDEVKITALITLVNAYGALGEYGKSFELAEETLKLADKTQKTHHKVWALGQMGEQYQKVHLHSVSRKYLDEAVEIINNSELSEENKAVSLGNIFAIKGNGYKEEIDCKIAIQNYDLAIKSYQKNPTDGAAENNLALVFLEKGNCLLETGAFGEAEEHFLKAKNIAEKNKLEEYRIEAKLGLAKVAAQRNDPEKVIVIGNEILNTMEKNIHLRAKNELYLLLQNAFAEVDDEANFMLFKEQYSSLAAQLSERENNRFQQVLEFIKSKKSQTNLTAPIFILVFSALFFLGILLLKLRKKTLLHS